MSQAGAFITGGTLGPLMKITGNIGGTVHADFTGNINIVGTGIVTVTGDQLTHKLSIGILDPIDVAHGGTGRSILTDHGVLLGSGLGSITATAAGSDGQILIGDSSGDPKFAFITSTAGTIDFTYGPGGLNIEVDHAVTFVHGDAGFAVPVAGHLTIAGGTNLTTAAGSSTLTVNLDASISNMTSVDFGVSGRIGTGLIAGDVLLFRAYDVDSATYVTFATLTANNIPTMDLDDSVTKAANYIYRAGGTDVPVTDGGTGVSTLTDHGVLVGSGTSAIDAITAGSDGQVLIGSTGADPIFGTISSTDGTIGFTTGAGTLDIDVNTSIRTASGWATWGGTGNYFDDTTLGDFTLLRPGTGYIHGKLISWLGGQTVSGLTAGNTYYIYIDDTGTIGKTTSYSQTLLENNILIFECMRDSTDTNIQVTVKANHSYKFQPAITYYTHESVGAVIENDELGANIAINGTKKIQINGSDTLSAQGLYTTIPDSATAAVVFKQYYTNAGGKWALYTSSDTFDGKYNAAGTPTALTAGNFGVYTLYASKDNLTVTTPVYYAVLDDTEYATEVSAQTAIAAGTVSYATNELAILELARLGYIIFKQSTDEILDVIVSKSTLRNDFYVAPSGSGSGTMTGLDGDSGSATPTAGVIKISGGTNLTSSAASSTVTINLDAAITGMTSVDFANGGRIGTGTTAADTLLLRAYDVDGTDYVTFATLTANDTPTMDLDDAVTKAGNYIYRASGTDIAVEDGGTGASTLTDHGILLGSGTGAITPLGVATDGQLPIGSTGADPVLATITAGAGISVTNAAGSITIANTGTGLAWSVITSDLNPMVVGNGYVCNKAGLLTLTLPTTSAVGTVLRVTGINTDLGWKIAQNASQIIHFGSADTTIGIAGSLASTLKRDSIELVCVVADLEWNVISSLGDITII